MTPVSHGKPCAGNPHARFDEGASASEEPRRNALLHKENAEGTQRARRGFATFASRTFAAFALKKKRWAVVLTDHVRRTGFCA